MGSFGDARTHTHARTHARTHNIIHTHTHTHLLLKGLFFGRAGACNIPHGDRHQVARIRNSRKLPFRPRKLKLSLILG